MPFPPSLSDISFRNWLLKGICTLENLYIDKKFSLFAMLRDCFFLPNAEFFRYLQIRNYVWINISNFVSLPKKEKVCRLLLGPPEAKIIISSFVDIFTEQMNFATNSLRVAWEEDLGLQIGDEVWDEGLGRILSCSINVRHQLIQLKVLHRLHYSKTKLPYMECTPQFLQSVANVSLPVVPCLICSGHVLDFTNIGATFLTGSQKYISASWFQTPWSNYWDIQTHLCISMQMTLMYGMVIAKKVILKLWKTDKVPPFKMWLTELTEILHM